MADWFSSRPFLDACTVLLSVAIGVLAKVSARKDKHRNDRMNDLAFGLDLLIASSILAMTKTVDHFSSLNRPGVDEAIRLALNTDLIMRIIVLFIMISAIFGIAGLIRWLGWKSKGKLNLFWGILVPDSVGFIALCVVSTRF